MKCTAAENGLLAAEIAGHVTAISDIRATKTRYFLPRAAAEDLLRGDADAALSRSAGVAVAAMPASPER